jgi:superfamily I DNA/RNA helicase/DNA polymerase III epsilon subunit-like protein
MTTPRVTLLPTATPARVPSASQRAAIDSPAGPLLVLAGPGAGKTFCLIERIRFLLEQLALPPERICAFTFTNKAAGEIAERLIRTLGDRAALVHTGTIHAFCAELLREFGSRIGLESGFGIADEKYQRAVLRRLGHHAKYHGSLLTRFGAHRFRGEPFSHQNDADLFERYERFLAQRNIVDFDMIVLKTAELLADPHVAQQVRARWDCVLVDEFQDLNPFQYKIIREMVREHRHIFAVGDEEQSIYAWAGADPRVFRSFARDFELKTQISLRENRRCSHEILAFARRLVEINEPMFAEKKELQASHESPFHVSAFTFPTDIAELAWVLEDIQRDREAHGVAWGDVALLYRLHRIGEMAEASFLAAGVPCRLAHGRAIGEDAVVAYVVAALRVISNPDDIHQEGFFEAVLPRTLLDVARARGAESNRVLRRQLEMEGRRLPKDDGDGKRIRRALYALKNLGALGRRHTTLVGLVEELLVQRVGVRRTILEEHHDELTDPLSHEEVVRLAERLAVILDEGRPIWLERRGGAEIALKGMLVAAGFTSVSLNAAPADGAEVIRAGDATSLGLPLTLFKALQLLRSRSFPNVFRDFTAVDIETTDRDIKNAEVVEIAAVRVRNGLITAQYHTLVRPSGSIAPGALRTHGISDADVAGSPSFDEMWPQFKEFCGEDVLVAHNGYQFDFPILRRLGGAELCTYDTLPLARELHTGSAKLFDLARHFGIDPGSSHRALDDTLALAKVCLALHELKITIARKAAQVNLLDHLGIALTLWPDPGLEAELLRGLCRPFTLGRYSDCFEFYDLERARAGDDAIPTVQQLIEWLGGARLMERIRAEKTADEKYPEAMPRMRRLLEQCANGSLSDQISSFLERVALSRSDGVNVQKNRINLLTLHSTKGLEFSRVYILGVEDSQLPGGSRRGATRTEVEEARRLLYVGMTRAKDRLVLTHVETRNGEPAGGHRFLDEMTLVPRTPA